MIGAKFAPNMDNFIMNQLFLLFLSILVISMLTALVAGFVVLFTFEPWLVLLPILSIIMIGAITVRQSRNIPERKKNEK